MGFFDFFSNKSKKQKLSHLASLHFLMRIDGNISDEEMKLLVKIGKERLKLSKEEIMSVLLNRFNDFAAPKNEKEFQTILYDLVFLMMADGVIDDREYKYCVKFASIFGYDSSAVLEMATNILKAATNKNVDVTNLSQQLAVISLKNYD